MLAVSLWAGPPLPAAEGPVTPPAGGELRGWSLPIRDAAGELNARLAGGSMRPLPNGELEIRDLRVETFRNGEAQAELTSPLCWYRPNSKEVHSTNAFAVRQSGGGSEMNGTGFLLKLESKEVSSAGNFTVRRAAGRGQVQGEGFWTDLDSRRMIVSNRVQALLPIPLPTRLRPSP